MAGRCTALQPIATSSSRRCNTEASLDTAQDGRIELAISDDILNETLRVLRDKFHRTTEWLQETDSHLRAITTHISATEKLDAVTADPDDNRILECALAARSEAVVTGDGHLLELGSFRGVIIMRVTEFLDLMQASR